MKSTRQAWLTPASRKWAQISLSTVLALFSFNFIQAQDFHKANFSIGGGVGFPVGQLGNFVNNGGNVVVGGGPNIGRHVSVNGEFMWQDLPINSTFLTALNASGAQARQYAVTIDPMVRFGVGPHAGAYAIGGIGWYHRSGETTAPTVGVICDPYWSWWFGCAVGTTTVITGSTSANAWGQNIGAGLTYRVGAGHTKVFAEFRYHHANYHSVSTEIIPLTFGLRW
jgi:hypothetical protein